VSPELPAGLGLDALTGVISGTPTTATVAANYAVMATNGAGSTTAIISIAVRGVSIFAICAPPVPDTTTGACLYPATCDAVLVGTPILDVTTAQLDFRLPVQINSSLLNNSGGGSINTNDAFIQSFEMNYSGASLASWSVGAAITVPTAGSSSAVLRLIPVAYFPALAPTGSASRSIVVNVRAHGVLATQNPFTPAWFSVPVAVCSGCLASYFTCIPPAVLVTFPSAAAPGVAPGQTATPACVTLQ
jgi:hypothetical protein